MKKIIMIVLAGLILSGCSTAKKEVVTTCIQNSANSTITTNLFADENAEIIRSEQTIELQFEESDVELNKQLIADEKESLKSIEGLSYEYSFDGPKATVVVTLEVSKLSEDQLLQFGFSDELKDESGKFNADVFAELFANYGITCTKK